MPEQAFEAAVRRRFEAAPGSPGDVIESGAGLAFDDQKLPGGRRVVVRLGFGRSGTRGSQTYRIVRTQHFPRVGDGHREFFGNRRILGARVAPGREAPAQQSFREGTEVGRLVASRFDVFAEQALTFGIALVEDHAGLHKRRGRHDETGGLDEADPFEMRCDVRIGSGHGSVAFRPEVDDADGFDPLGADLVERADAFRFVAQLILELVEASPPMLHVGVELARLFLQEGERELVEIRFVAAQLGGQMIALAFQRVAKPLGLDLATAGEAFPGERGLRLARRVEQRAQLGDVLRRGVQQTLPDHLVRFGHAAGQR